MLSLSNNPQKVEEVFLKVEIIRIEKFNNPTIPDAVNNYVPSPEAVGQIFVIQRAYIFYSLCAENQSRTIQIFLSFLLRK